MTAITLPRAVVEQALEALEFFWNAGYRNVAEQQKTLITALRERLTQPEQEPVQFKCTVIDDAHPNGIPLEQWAKPPQREWVDLTPKEIEACRQEGYLHSGLNAPFDFDRAAGAVLAKAKEKNT